MPTAPPMRKAASRNCQHHAPGKHCRKSRCRCCCCSTAANSCLKSVPRRVFGAACGACPNWPPTSTPPATAASASASPRWPSRLSRSSHTASPTSSCTSSRFGSSWRHATTRHPAKSGSLWPMHSMQRCPPPYVRWSDNSTTNESSDYCPCCICHAIKRQPDKTNFRRPVAQAYFFFWRLVLLTCLLSPQTTTAGIIVNPDVEGHSISITSLRNIYTQRQTLWPNHQHIVVFVLPDDHPAHVAFAKEKLGLYPYRLRLTWDRMSFSGMASAPIQGGGGGGGRARGRAAPGAGGGAGGGM